MNKTRLIIAGGGFAGLSAAMYLDKTVRKGLSSSQRWDDWRPSDGGAE
jgi:NADH dehydrogenase FAD-containing subunit